MLRRLVVCLALAASSGAWAHIKLLAPAEWLVTDGLGDPQKTGQCGSTTGTPTNAVTTVTAGSTLHVRWQETVLHPGHFRIAIATDRSQLMDPQVTVNAGVCISAAVQNPVVAPVIADGLFEHTTAAPNNTYDTDITVPNTPCDHCTLQLVQFMAAHGAPCIYYHCADLRIVAPDAGSGGGAGGGAAGGAGGGAAGGAGGGAGGSGGSGGSAGSAGGGTGGGTSDGGTTTGPSGGCSCQVADASLFLGAGLLLLLLAARRVRPG